MRAIAIDDEPLMLRAFMRLTEDIHDLNIEGTFENAEDAIKFSEGHAFEIAFLDIKLPGMDGIECARKLREKQPGILIVFISAYDEFLWGSNQIGGDDYLVKPYKKETIEKTIEKMRLLVRKNNVG